jgi:gluconolactonase
MVLDVNTGKVEPFYDRPLLTRFRGVNDLFFGAQGDIYFTDQGQTGLHDPSGRLYCLEPTGNLHEVLNNEGSIA